MDDKSSEPVVGMDVQEDLIDIAVAEEAAEVRHHGRVGGASGNALPSQR